jgi:hypothetical protein
LPGKRGGLSPIGFVSAGKIAREDDLLARRLMAGSLGIGPGMFPQSRTGKNQVSRTVFVQYTISDFDALSPQEIVSHCQIHHPNLPF